MPKQKLSIGIVAGNFSPFHIGHMELVKRSCQENKWGVVYASKKARGQLCPKALERVWHEHIDPILPSNCKVFHLDISPVRQIYDYLGTAEENRGGESYRIYTESSDGNKNFNLSTMAKYYPWLISQGNIEIISIPRSTNHSISGTDMRNFIKMGDKESFCSFLPDCDKEKVWNLLYSSN